MMLWIAGDYLMAPPAPLVAESAPYRMMECGDGLWCVEYTFQADLSLMAGAFADPEFRRKMVAKAATPEEKTIAEAEACLECCRLSSAEMKKGALFDRGFRQTSRMFVFKDPSDGKLILYSPVDLGTTIGEFLTSKGDVNAIISSSGAHTLFVKSATIAYPGATVIASDAAARKLRYAGVNVDIIYTTTSTLRSVADPRYIEFVVLDGDPVQEKN